MIKGVIRITVFSATVALMGYLVLTLSGLALIHSTFFGFVGFFWSVNVGIHCLVHFCKDVLDIEYHMLLLAAVGIRLIIALFAFLFVSFFVKEDRMLFAANFSAVYLSFLVFEIISVLSNLRPNSSQVKNQ